MSGLAGEAIGERVEVDDRFLGGGEGDAVTSCGFDRRHPGAWNSKSNREHSVPVGVRWNRSLLDFMLAKRSDNYCLLPISA